MPAVSCCACCLTTRKLRSAQATSESHLGEFVYQQHPNLRKRTTLKFTSREMLEPCDVLFLALPHGESQKHIDHYAAISAPKIIDLAADFRIRDAALYKKYYGEDHLAPAWLDRFVYGLPELHREEMCSASYISGVGCNATAANLSLLPIMKAGLADLEKPIIVDIKVGSSEAGQSPNPGIASPRAFFSRAHLFGLWAPPHGRGDPGIGLDRMFT